MCSSDLHLSRYLEKKPVNWILDLRLILRERKEKTRQLFYYKADSHWNFLGALWGFQAIGEALARIGYPISSPIRESDLTALPFDRAAEFLYIPISPSSGSSFELKHPILDCIKKEEAPHFEDLPRFSKIVEITTCKKGRWKAVVIKDSFFDYLRLYISSSFSRVS